MPGESSRVRSRSVRRRIAAGRETEVLMLSELPRANVRNIIFQASRIT